MAKVKVFVTPKKGVLDPQGKTVETALHTLGYKNVSGLQIGKYIELELPNQLTNQQTNQQVEEMAKKLLSNPVIEDFRYEVIK
ncbi:MAG: phosphoribosylformylglycinamidine synthase subunit PurS [bacterium]